ncbi:MAG TPA: zeta toxin family protein [Chitinophagales bacterium]|nr:zeta toxin family protein [Chitinophagales bacterium]
MPNKKMYIIAGCNGAGKTTASFNILPAILHCKEYVNADEIARGLSPFQPEKVAFEAARIMLKRIDELLLTNEDFAFETTLATRSFHQLIDRAKKLGYSVTLIYFWLSTTELAELRVQRRVEEGGHDIPPDVIKRRYYRGIENLFKLYQDLCDFVFVYDNSDDYPELVYERELAKDMIIHNTEKLTKIKLLLP